MILDPLPADPDLLVSYSNKAQGFDESACASGYQPARSAGEEQSSSKQRSLDDHFAVRIMKMTHDLRAPVTFRLPPTPCVPPSSLIRRPLQVEGSTCEAGYGGALVDFEDLGVCPHRPPLPHTEFARQTADRHSSPATRATAHHHAR